MKIGLVTFYHIHHYGAALQAAATERAVESLGHDCEILDYYVNQNNALFQPPKGLGSAAHDGSSSSPGTICAFRTTTTRAWRSCGARTCPMT